VGTRRGLAPDRCSRSRVIFQACQGLATQLPRGLYSEAMSTTPGATVPQAPRGVHDPGRGEDIVTIGLVKDLHVHDGDVTFTLAFAGQSPAAKASRHSSATKV